MTFEERMAELGVDLSDLKPVAERRYDRDGHPVTVQAALMDYYADVIDRMETRLVNLTGERDWLKGVLERHLFCETCERGNFGTTICARAHLCGIDDPQYVYSGVPEDWRTDDA